MTDNLLANLSAPFRPDQVDWRIGATNKDKTKGMALAYIDSRAVMHRLDDVCGTNWQCEYIPMPNHTCCCRIGIKIGDEWIWRSNGAINYPDSDKPEAKEMAAKGTYSDAFKRAAVLWGIGQYLYDLDSPWVDIVAKGSSHVFADGVRAQLDRRIGKVAANGAHHEATPTSTIAGRRNEAKGASEAREWVNAEALPTLANMAKPADLTVWLGANANMLAGLEAAFPDQFKALDARINRTMDRLMSAGPA